MVDYRPIPDERDVFHEYRRYAFTPHEGVPAYDPAEHDTPRATLGARRGLYEHADDERPRCVCRHYWLEAHVRGETHATAGLASVATPPEYRRAGYVRQLLAESLAEYRTHGVRFSVLWPFRYRFYRQYGWDTANRIVTHECDPGALSFAADRDRGSVGPVDADEYDAIEPVYDEWTDRHALALDRDETWWRHRVFGGHDVDPFVYAYERDGEPHGYLVYTIDDDGGEQTMTVTELAAVDHGAYRAMLAFCYDHDSQVDRVRFRMPADDLLRATAADPDEIETIVENGPMVRIVDVADTLAALSYLSLDRSLTLAVADPLADWNDRTFSLDVSDGRAECARIDSPAADDPDVTLDVATLSQLAVGARSAATLDRLGRLQDATPETVATLADLFPERDVYLGEFF
ncbi:enhanced intracellular survival protein Eis [Halosolutus amylolyticus]|uniref:Enhanced intracellular survival protein Eis n=1 Tax=Halosolutus amylolyticus TaxID=2932267 RepID=A0ABD5PVM0_9EURY|nr:GNAT family N-acetyltransferase [Halosolutus amylolyticus]